MSALLGGLDADGELLVIGVATDAMDFPVPALLQGSRSLQGWYCGIATDSEDTMRFSVLRHVRPMVETFPLERAGEAFERMVSNRVRFIAVLRP